MFDPPKYSSLSLLPPEGDTQGAVSEVVFVFRMISWWVGWDSNPGPTA